MDCQDWWENAPVGCKFDPTDFELIWGYLYPMVRTGGTAKGLIKDSDQVYKNPPWQFCTDLGALRRHGKYYFFTELKKMSKNRVVRTVGTHGTWHESSSKKILGKNNYIHNNNNNGIIGYKKLLNFKKGEGKQMKPTDWLMHEFSLPGKETTVLCVIQNKKKEEEMGSAYDTFLESDLMSFIDLDSTTSAGGDPCPAPAPAHEDQALDSEEEEEETRPSKKMRSDTLDGDPFSGGDPCPAPAPAPAHEDQALDSKEEEIRQSRKMPSDRTFGGDPFSGGDPRPAPASASASAHDDHLELQEETWPGKEMLSDPKLDDHPVSGASSGVGRVPPYWKDFADDLLDGASGLLYDASGVPEDGLSDFQTHPFNGDLLDGASLPADGASGLLYDVSGSPDDGLGIFNNGSIDFQIHPFNGDS